MSENGRLLHDLKPATQRDLDPHLVQHANGFKQACGVCVCECPHCSFNNHAGQDAEKGRCYMLSLALRLAALSIHSNFSLQLIDPSAVSSHTGKVMDRIPTVLQPCWEDTSLMHYACILVI